MHLNILYYILLQSMSYFTRYKFLSKKINDLRLSFVVKEVSAGSIPSLIPARLEASTLATKLDATDKPSNVWELMATSTCNILSQIVALPSVSS